MCIALPRRIVAVLDAESLLLGVADEQGIAQESVSAALVATPDLSLASLVGAYAIVHAGFVLSIVDAAEARSRLQVFAALRGEELNLSEFYADTTDVQSLIRSD